MKNSIIITFFNGKYILDECLCQLQLSLLGRNDTEIIIVNDNPNISLDYIIKKFKDLNIKCEQLKQNMGHPYACNRGVEISNGENVIIMDCDILVTKNWLVELEKIMDSNENVGAISSTILSLADQTIVIWGVAIHGVDSLKPLRGNHILLNEDVDFNYLTSGCLMLKKEVFNKVKGFDTMMYNSYCDIDLALKIKKINLRNIMSHQSIVYHKGRVAGKVRNLSNNDTKAYFFKKWGENIIDDGLDILREVYTIQLNNIDIEKSYIIFNFSTSLFINDYINLILDTLQINLIDYNNYKIHTNPNGVDLFDMLDNNYLTYKIPFIFLANDYRIFENNYYWSSVRSQNDLVIDTNGNIFTLKEINRKK